jgi:hypothetical protein
MRTGYPALSAHVEVADASCEATSAQITALKCRRAKRFGIRRTTIQFERSPRVTGGRAIGRAADRPRAQREGGRFVQGGTDQGDKAPADAAPSVQRRYLCAVWRSDGRALCAHQTRPGRLHSLRRASMNDEPCERDLGQQAVPRYAADLPLEAASFESNRRVHARRGAQGAPALIRGPAVDPGAHGAAKFLTGGSV